MDIFIRSSILPYYPMLIKSFKGSDEYYTC